ncbi:alpha/beta hydrolase [Pseudomonas sp. P7759]|uniref:alpha/beta fold hydrolase n=1 Tax=Pseudomonas sp. P7759 TaxID=2738831 RepID=UPI00159FA297|nr:alpha/beta hydrolase [Pseudomonas sp. P7759]NWC75747.1 alpha/beta hydrolase [Pseudomonas sp. P7759]
MKTFFPGLALALAICSSAFAATSDTKPTIVLIHGAFADSSSWNGVTQILHKDGYDVIAAANPLRGLANDSRSVVELIRTLKHPVVLVGHSYGGPVITEAAKGNSNVKGLVFVSAVAPEKGESVHDIMARFPGSTLPASLEKPVELSDGNKDLYIQQDKFHDQIAADLPEAATRLAAIAQRPITAAALSDAATEATWKTLPSWFVFGDADKAIPPAALAFMAERAHSKQTVVVKGASHAVMISNPQVVADLIEKAAQ